jgi:uncharacterized protein YpuA (DUF1002 family)
MNTKIKKIITACALFLGLGLTAGGVSAAEDTTPVITLGTSLTASQKQGTLDVLKRALSDSSSYNTLTVTGSDLVTYLNPSGSSFTSSSGVWSSAAIEKNTAPAAGSTSASSTTTGKTTSLPSPPTSTETRR